MRKLFLPAIIAGMVSLSGCNTEPESSDRPNIVWIVLEDITPMMGCYGDEYAKTPVFDQLAAEGIRYEKAYSVAPRLLAVPFRGDYRDVPHVAGNDPSPEPPYRS